LKTEIEIEQISAKKLMKKTSFGRKFVKNFTLDMGADGDGGVNLDSTHSGKISA
jgi:hypothetical protein